MGSHTGPPARLKVIQTINHQGEINRARYAPFNPNLLATKTTSGEVFVFDRTKHASEAGAGAGCKPDIRLTGQTREGSVAFIFLALSPCAAQRADPSHLLRPLRAATASAGAPSRTGTSSRPRRT